MSQIQIILPEDTTKKLKILATKADRSLKKFIPLYLNHIVDLDIIDVDERTGAFITSVTQFPSPSPSAITLDQLKEAGVKDFKFDKALSASPIDPERRLLQQQKLDIEKQKIKKKRIELLKEKSMEILGFILPYIEKEDQKTIDYVLNTYQTDEDLINYLTQIKNEEQFEEDSYDYQFEIEQFEEHLPHPLSETYQTIKSYCMAHDTMYDLYQLLKYPSAIQIENYDDIIKSALDTPMDYTFTPDEVNLLLSYFTPIKN